MACPLLLENSSLVYVLSYWKTAGCCNRDSLIMGYRYYSRVISAVGGAAAFRRLSAEGGHRKGAEVGQNFWPRRPRPTTTTTTTNHPPIEISGMEPLYRKMMNMKNVQNFFPDMMGQKFLAYDRKFCHFLVKFRILAPNTLLEGKWSICKRCGFFFWI